MAGHAFSNFVKRPTFVASDKALARYVARPVLRFIDTEVASGILLLIATAAALIWANAGDSYNEFWHTEMLLEVGSWTAEMSLAHFVNDALMALFFFVVGLEIKRELVVGRLANPRVAALPGIAALGGMVVPALLFFLVNLGGDGVPGWGVHFGFGEAF